MTDREGQLLYSALCYEEGHPRRTQHILKVYALAKMLARQAELDEHQEAVLGAGPSSTTSPSRTARTGA